MPIKTRHKIWTHKYIDFNDLLRYDENNRPQYTMTLNSSSDTPTLKLHPQTQTHPDRNRVEHSLVQTHGCVHPHIPRTTGRPHHLFANNQRTMHKGLAWGDYDRRFRMDREYSHCSWSTLRVDLQLSIQTLDSTTNIPALSEQFPTPTQRPLFPVPHQTTALPPYPMSIQSPVPKM